MVTGDVIPHLLRSPGSAPPRATRLVTCRLSVTPATMPRGSEPRGASPATQQCGSQVMAIFVAKRVAEERRNFLERGTQELNTLFPGTPVTGDTQQGSN